MTEYIFQRMHEHCGKPPIAWMLHGVLPLEGLAALYGPPGSGKSFLALDLATAIAEGREWFGLYVQQRPVTYVCLEGERGLGARVDAWCARNGRELPKALISLADKQPFNLRVEEDMQALVKGILAQSGTNGLLIIDTLNQASPGSDENSSSDMSRIIAAMKRLQVKLGGLVLVVHHTGKDASRGLRGHSSLLAALDVAIEVSKLDFRFKWLVAKSKDGVTGTSLFFELAIEEIGEYPYGPKVTSCAVVPITVNAEESQRGTPQGTNQCAVVKALKPLFEAGVEGATYSADGKYCILLADAILVAMEGLSENVAKSKRKYVARTTIEMLVEKSVYGMEGDWLWEI